MLKGIPILGSALAHPYIAAMKIGDCSGLVDVGNLHAYPGGRAPEITLPLYVGYVQPQYPKMKYAITENCVTCSCRRPTTTSTWPCGAPLPAAAKTVRVYRPTQSGEPVTTEENVDRLLLQLGAEAVILQISPKKGRIEP
jgi:hypothetical protein